MQKETANGIEHRFVDSNGIRIHLAEAGEGSLVLLCHGYPQTWYSWRHQLSALAKAGFRAVAVDMRGYGLSDAPAAVDQYTLLHLVGDVVGILRPLEADTAVIVGHDWGAQVAWTAAMLRPDRFRGVVALSVPHRPRGRKPPTSVMPRTEDAVFYQLYFQDPGVAEADLESDVMATLRGGMLGLAGEAAEIGSGMAMTSISRGMSEANKRAAAEPLPSWLSDADLDIYVKEFTRTGFRGALNWFRNVDRNWELTAPFAGSRITVPALYVAGERDMVTAFPGGAEAIAALPRWVPNLREPVLLPGCGHWTQEERPDEVNTALIDFLRSL